MPSNAKQLVLAPLGRPSSNPCLLRIARTTLHLHTPTHPPTHAHNIITHVHTSSSLLVFITQALLKKPCSKALSGRNASTPFDNESSIEFLCSKNDCGLFTFGSHSKKRPHNIVMVRVQCPQPLCGSYGNRNGGVRPSQQCDFVGLLITIPAGNGVYLFLILCSQRHPCIPNPCWQRRPFALSILARSFFRFPAPSLLTRSAFDHSVFCSVRFATPLPYTPSLHPFPSPLPFTPAFQPSPTQGRTFDNQLLDMMEFGIENFISIDTFKVRTTAVSICARYNPCRLFYRASRPPTYIGCSCLFIAVCL